MKITFLGTSAMLPTKERNPNAIFISYNTEGILIDCAEGTQRQLRIAGISPSKITKLLITHWHGDHVLGIPGLLQSLSMSNYNKVLQIYGPKGSKEFLKNMLNGLIFKSRIKYEITEINNGVFYKDKDLILKADEVKHNAPCLSYSIIEQDKYKINLDYTKKFGLTQHPLLGELQKGKNITYQGKLITVNKATILKKGKKVAIIIDSSYEKNLINISKNANLLICESTWLEKDKLKDYDHLTSKQAGIIAKKSKVKKLILTHFSQRYKSLDEVLKEARKEFKNTECAYDLMNLEV